MPGLDLGSFPAPEVSNTFLFRQSSGFWSVARVGRRTHHIVMFDGASQHNHKDLQQDSDRTSRLRQLDLAIKSYLPQLNIPDGLSRHNVGRSINLPRSTEPPHQGWKAGGAPRAASMFLPKR